MSKIKIENLVGGAKDYNHGRAVRILPGESNIDFYVLIEALSNESIKFYVVNSPLTRLVDRRSKDDYEIDLRQIEIDYE